MPAPMFVPASRSIAAICHPPHARTIAEQAPNAAATMSAARRHSPCGMKVPVASASSFPSRAAIAAPRNPTQSVRC